jgi:hypothetical protein
MADVASKPQPQVTVRNIPQEDYNQNPASGAMGGEPTEPGIKGHLKKYGMIYLIAIGVITVIVIIMFRQNGGAGAAGSTSGSDPYGYGTGNSSPSDLYGSQLDSDYQQMINQENQTNALLQQLLNQPTTKKTGGGGSKGGGKGSGGGKKGGGDDDNGKTGSGTGGHGKPTHGGGTKTKPGGNTGGSSKGHHGSVSGGHGGQGRYTGTSIPKEPMVKGNFIPDPSAHGAHGWVYTTKPGDTLFTLQSKFWPQQTARLNNNSFISNYANNKQLIKGRVDFSKNAFGVIKPGTRIIA